MSDLFRVVFVCTGNICRSPAAERLLAARIPPGTGVTIESAGTSALVGAPMSPPMAGLLTRAGFDVSAFRARTATTSVLRNADLVVGLSRAHRAAVVSLEPSLVRRAFTLRELARLADRLPTEISVQEPVANRLRTLTESAARLRRPAPAALDDIEDPYRQSEAVYARCFALIHESIAAISGVLHLP